MHVKDHTLTWLNFLNPLLFHYLTIDHIWAAYWDFRFFIFTNTEQTGYLSVDSNRSFHPSLFSYLFMRDNTYIFHVRLFISASLICSLLVKVWEVNRLIYYINRITSWAGRYYIALYTYFSVAIILFNLTMAATNVITVLKMVHYASLSTTSVKHFPKLM